MSWDACDSAIENDPDYDSLTDPESELLYEPSESADASDDEYLAPGTAAGDPRTAVYDSDLEILQQEDAMSDFHARTYATMKRFLASAREVRQREVRFLAKHERADDAVLDAEVDFVAWPKGYEDLECTAIAVLLTAKYINPVPSWCTPTLQGNVQETFDDISRGFAVNVLLDLSRILADDGLDEVVCRLAAIQEPDQLKKVRHMRVAPLGGGQFQAVFNDGPPVPIPCGGKLQTLGAFLYFFWDAYAGVGRFIEENNAGFADAPLLCTYAYEIAPRILEFVHLIHANLMHHMTNI